MAAHRSRSEAVREALTRPQSYAHHPAAVEVRETHLSWVFLAGELAYKLKKPLVLDFVDYGTPARRRSMCEQEVELNRRLAPEVYLGVRGVVLGDGDQAELTAADDPRAVDFVVEMRRYDERETLAARLRHGELGADQVRAVAAVLARFHAQARQVVAPAQLSLAAERRFERNLHELLTYVEQPGEIGRLLALERFVHAFTASRRRTFEMRASSGLVREGHGDLRAEHVLIDGQVEIVDCVEFDRGLRELDVADDLAFLVSDLAACGGDRFGEPLVQAYRAAGGCPGDDSLVAFYAVYRALVRAKVALLRCSQLDHESSDQAHERASARMLIALAERFAWRARLPLAIVVCGLPASGKSHLASALAELSGLPHLSSDVTRKRLVGLPASRRAPAAVYSAQWDARVYAELARDARDALITAGGALVDATFRGEAQRRTFLSTFGESAPLLFLECQAPVAVVARRAASRERDPTRISDADQAVAMREAMNWRPLHEISAQAHVVLRTDRPLERILEDVMALLDQRLQRGLAAPQ